MGTYVLQSFLRQTGIICLTGGGCEAVRKARSPTLWHPCSSNWCGWLYNFRYIDVFGEL